MILMEEKNQPTYEERKKQIFERTKNIKNKIIVFSGIVLASCISKGNPIGFPCPHFDKIKKSVAEKLNPKTRLLDWTH